MTEPIRIEIPTQFAVGPVNSYLFTEPEPILVDAGVPTAAGWQTLLAGLQAEGLTIADVRQVIITHPHIDHFGLAAKITRHSNATVAIADIGVDWLREPAKMWHNRLSYYTDYFLPHVGMNAEQVAVVANYMDAVAAVSEPVPPARLQTFKMGDNLAMGGYDWVVMHMPGHSQWQTCFYQPETAAFISADHLLHKAPTPIVERPLAGGERIPALPQFLDSLDRTYALEIQAIYPGHGATMADHRALIARQRERIQLRKAECLQHIAAGAETAVAIVDKMYAHIPAPFRLSGLWMAIGYLDLLLAAGDICQIDDGTVCRYHIVD